MFLNSLLGGQWRYDASAESYRREPALSVRQCKTLAACLDVTNAHALKHLNTDHVTALQALGGERQFMLSLQFGGLAIADTCVALEEQLGGVWRLRANEQDFYAHLFNPGPITKALTQQGIAFTFQGNDTAGTLDIAADQAELLVEKCEQSRAARAAFCKAKTLSEPWERTL